MAIWVHVHTKETKCVVFVILTQLSINFCPLKPCVTCIGSHNVSNPMYFWWFDICFHQYKVWSSKKGISPFPYSKIHLVLVRYSYEYSSTLIQCMCYMKIFYNVNNVLDNSTVKLYLQLESKLHPIHVPNTSVSWTPNIHCRDWFYLRVPGICWDFPFNIPK